MPTRSACRSGARVWNLDPAGNLISGAPPTLQPPLNRVVCAVRPAKGATPETVHVDHGRLFASYVDAPAQLTTADNPVDADGRAAGSGRGSGWSTANPQKAVTVRLDPPRHRRPHRPTSGAGAARARARSLIGSFLSADGPEGDRPTAPEQRWANVIRVERATPWQEGHRRPVRAATRSRTALARTRDARRTLTPGSSRVAAHRPSRHQRGGRSGRRVPGRARRHAGASHGGGQLVYPTG